MARKPMVTRTITTTKANVLCMDIQSAEPFNKVITLPRSYKDDKILMKRAREVVETDSIKVVHIVDKEEVETLYGMTEQEFIENGVVLDRETRKVLESDVEPEAQEEVEQ